MSNGGWPNQEEEQLAEYLVRQVCDRAAGRTEDECLYNYPHDVYFIGNLRPVPLDTDDAANQRRPQYLQELLTKLSPVAFGADFSLQAKDDNEINVDVTVSWACYYRVFPDRQQQIQYQQQQQPAPPEGGEGAQEAQGNEGPDEDETVAAVPEDSESEDDSSATVLPISGNIRGRGGSGQRDKLFIRFKKIQCEATGAVIIRRNSSVGWVVDCARLQEELNRETRRAQEIATSDPIAIRTDRSPDDRVQIPEPALDSEPAFTAFCQRLRTPVVPTWSWEARADLRETIDPSSSSSLLLMLEFTNQSPMPENSLNTEAYFFDARAKFIFRGCNVVPFELELAPRGFRYDRWLWGRGFNCAINRFLDSQAGTPTFETTNTPIYPQMRYSTRTQPSAPFDQLARDPVPVLERILRAMQSDRREWDAQRIRYQQDDPEWEGRHGSEYDRDRQQFESEIARFERGLNLIRANPDVRLAFKLTNETFRRGPKSEWRLFQIVFLVGQIPGIAALADPQTPDVADRDIVDIIYFPTGGGKTEAYLATIVFHIFFDRLRGKSAGVTAWTRFPLRLLTLQQTQRVADIIALAELVRSQQSDPRLNRSDVDGFAVGYFVGQEATPNELTPPQPGQSPEPTWSTATDDSARQRWKKIMRCPACRTATVRVDFDAAAVRVLHRCTRANCAFTDGILPIYVIDNEIYRYLPCVVVGTIDKLAALGNQRKLSLVLGQVDGRCPDHGYYKGRCCQKDCTNRRLPAGAPSGLSGPTLFVQDELHLLREGLGTYDSHYETFLQRLLREFGQRESLKVIASSATVEAFERQVEHLYGGAPRSARAFPGPGPTLERSFYAETFSYPQRLYVGLIPHNKTIFNAILELIQYYHEAAQSLQRLTAGETNPYGGQVPPGSPEWQRLIDDYVTSLTYFSDTQSLNSVRTDLESQVNTDLEKARFRSLTIAELTGNTGSDEVTRILDQLETTLPQPGRAPDAVLATSMISHGVDVDRLNAMFFYGMPRQNSEYIQASSRVGRSHTGIVFMCLRPERERDQSHYAYFTKFHEFLGQLVEPVAINRWSKFSVQRTLPGLFMGVLLQVIAHRPGAGNPGRFYILDYIKKAITDRDIRAQDFIPLLEEAYQVNASAGAGPDAFREEINLRVNQFLDQIVGASSQSFVSGALFPPPMNSLRDVDEQLEIELDNAGTSWAGGRSRT